VRGDEVPMTRQEFDCCSISHASRHPVRSSAPCRTSGRRTHT
jgi:hypothetical protein